MRQRGLDSTVTYPVSPLSYTVLLMSVDPPYFCHNCARIRHEFSFPLPLVRDSIKSYSSAFSFWPFVVVKFLALWDGGNPDLACCIVNNCKPEQNVLESNGSPREYAYDTANLGLLSYSRTISSITGPLFNQSSSLRFVTPILRAAFLSLFSSMSMTCRSFQCPGFG